MEKQGAMTAGGRGGADPPWEHQEDSRRGCSGCLEGHIELV